MSRWDKYQKERVAGFKMSMTYKEARGIAERILAEFRQQCPEEFKLLHRKDSGPPSLSVYMIPVIFGKRQWVNIGFELVFHATDAGFEIVREQVKTTVTKLWEGTA